MATLIHLICLQRLARSPELVDAKAAGCELCFRLALYYIKDLNLKRLGYQMH